MESSRTKDLHFAESARNATEPLPFTTEGLREFVDLVSQNSGASTALYELVIEKVFFKAVKTLVELCDSPEDEISVRAASKLADLRNSTYKSVKTKNIVEPLMNKLFEDGFD